MYEHKLKICASKFLVQTKCSRESVDTRRVRFCLEFFAENLIFVRVECLMCGLLGIKLSNYMYSYVSHHYFAVIQFHLNRIEVFTFINENISNSLLFYYS
jgi:hypothetical protein